MIAQTKIDEIINSANIEDVIGEVVRLKKRGANLLGNCPFHNEKTPSFTVSPAKSIYKCFGCGKAGNVVNFVMEHDQLGYIEALKTLAEKYGIEWPKQENVNIEHEKHLKTEKESLQILNNWAADFFEENIWETEEGKNIGLTYFEERGFRSDTIKKFKLGYSLDSWDDFYNKAIASHFNEEIVLKSGLVKESDAGKKYDAYRGRVIFPIQGTNGKIIAFAGRQLKKDDKSPKYVNSPETLLYHKSNELYGLFFAKNTIRKNDFVYLVEGYTDVISLHQAGVENVVASSGTSLTENQIKLIKRQTDNVTVLFDGDNAGIKASLRGIDMLLEQGLNVKVVLFPDGEDPDSYCKKVGSDQFAEYLLKNAKDFILFKVNLLLADVQNDPVKKATVTRDIVESIGKIPDGIKRMAFIKECSYLLDMNEQVLITELNKTRRDFLTQKEKEWVAPEKKELNYQEEIAEILDESSLQSQELQIIKLLLLFGHLPVNEYKNAAHFVLNKIAEEEIDFEHEMYNLILAEYRHLLTNDLPVEEDYFIKHQNPVFSSIAATALATHYELSPKWESKYEVYLVPPNENYIKEINSALLHLKLRNTQKLIQHNLKDIELAQQNANDESMLLHQFLHKTLKDKEQEIANILGAVVIK